MTMSKQYNILLVFSPDEGQVLMCLRRKPPYRGKLNFIGGKIEAGESSETAAYRELWEETAIPRDALKLTHIMDLSYPLEENNFCEVWVGRLCRDVEVRGDENELIWVNTDTDFSDVSRFAGAGNIYHMIQYVFMTHDQICWE